MNTRILRIIALPMLSLCVAVGCTDTAETTDGNSAPGTDLPPGTMDDHAGHAHPSEGPHHGDLVELGNEEYHGEVVHNEETGGVTIYILDGSATKQVAIAATDVRINVKHDGKPEQFKLAAKPDDGDEEGKSSRFVSEDKELGQHLGSEDAAPQLVVKVDDKSYRGSIGHSHDHEGHAHD